MNNIARISCKSILFLTECGVAPVVKLNCTDNGFVNVKWNAPGCSQRDCKANLICDNGTALFHDKVHSMYMHTCTTKLCTYPLATDSVIFCIYTDQDQ